ncbi:MAG: hypothetical protein ABI315_04850 [Bacteroidia bacterium]
MLFILKIAAGICVWNVYTYYYESGDIHLFYDDAERLYQLLIKTPKEFIKVIFQDDPSSKLMGWNSSFEPILYNDSRTIILMNLFFRFFSFGYVQVHTVFVNFLSLIGLMAIYKTFYPYFQNKKIELLIAIFFIPSVLFWGSAILKEGLLFFGMGILIYESNCGLRKSYSLNSIFKILFSICILLVVKFYILFALLPGLIANRWEGKIAPKSILLKYLTVMFLCVFGLWVAASILPQYNVLKIITDKQKKSFNYSQGGVFLSNSKELIRVNYYKQDNILIPLRDNLYQINPNSEYEILESNNKKMINKTSDDILFSKTYTMVPPKSIIAPLNLEPTIGSFIKNVPKAITNTLTIPSIFEIDSWIKIIPAIENLLICIGILVLPFYFKSNAEDLPIIYFCLTFTFLVFLLAGLTTPIVGALVRYKTPALPFLMIIIFLSTDKNKLKRNRCAKKNKRGLIH